MFNMEDSGVCYELTLLTCKFYSINHDGGKKIEKKKTHMEKKKRRNSVGKYATQNVNLLLKLSPLAESPVWPLEAAVQSGRQSAIILFQIKINPFFSLAGASAAPCSLSPRGDGSQPLCCSSPSQKSLTERVSLPTSVSVTESYSSVQEGPAFCSFWP